MDVLEVCRGGHRPVISGAGFYFACSGVFTFLCSFVHPKGCCRAGIRQFLAGRPDPNRTRDWRCPVGDTGGTGMYAIFDFECGRFRVLLLEVGWSGYPPLRMQMDVWTVLQRS